MEEQQLSKSLLSWWRETGVAAAQQILAELVEGVLSWLVLSRVSQTQHGIFAESISCLLWQLCGATSQAVCGTPSEHIL